MKQKNIFKRLGILCVLLSIITFVLMLVLYPLDFDGVIDLSWLFNNRYIMMFIAGIVHLLFTFGVIFLIIGLFKGNSSNNSIVNFIKSYYVNKYNSRMRFYNFNNANTNNYDKEKKGQLGEKEVEYELNHLDRGKSKVLNNITIKAPYNDVAQIDHLVVSENGIYHIETKTYQGHIQIDQYGSWIRTINGNTFGEESPLSQVQKHQRVLVSLLGNKYPIIPIVAIADKRTVIQGKENFPCPILTLGTIHNYIENTNTQGIKLSYSEREMIMQTIINSLTENKQF